MDFSSKLIKITNRADDIVSSRDACRDLETMSQVKKSSARRYSNPCFLFGIPLKIPNSPSVIRVIAYASAITLILAGAGFIVSLTEVMSVFAFIASLYLAPELGIHIENYHWRGVAAGGVVTMIVLSVSLLCITVLTSFTP